VDHQIKVQIIQILLLG